MIKSIRYIGIGLWISIPLIAGGDYRLLDIRNNSIHTATVLFSRPDRGFSSSNTIVQDFLMVCAGGYAQIMVHTPRDAAAQVYIEYQVENQHPVRETLIVNPDEDELVLTTPLQISERQKSE
jgi:hypothetical protein